MHVSTKIIEILLIYIINIHRQVSNVYPPPPFKDQYLPFGLNDLCEYGRTTRNIEELKNIYYITLRHLYQHTYVKNFKRFKYFLKNFNIMSFPQSVPISHPIFP
jgi:hypothetical protein